MVTKQSVAQNSLLQKVTQIMKFLKERPLPDKACQTDHIGPLKKVSNDESDDEEQKEKKMRIRIDRLSDQVRELTDELERSKEKNATHLETISRLEVQRNEDIMAI